MGKVDSTPPTGAPPFLLSVPINTKADDGAKKLALLASLAGSLRSAAADCPPNDPETRARVMAADTAAAQLVAHLRRQEPVSAQIERLTAERTAALAEMRQARADMARFSAACRAEAELAARIRRLRAEVRS